MVMMTGRVKTASHSGDGLKNSWQAMKGMGRVDLNAIESASSETARHINREIVLQLIRARQPISRAELARVSGLQRSTVSQIIEQLIRERWIREGAIAQLPRGRRPTMLVLNDDLVVLAADIHPRQVTVDISDTGMGMNEETRKRCLEPFFSTKGKRGTGLGLAMVYGVMERHKGSIEIISVLGKGTTFRLLFPICKRLPTLQPEKDVPIKIEPMQILCIDDESSLRELLKEILERDGHEVVLSDSGQSGLDEFRIASERHRPFDLVITDLGMPYLDGRQVAKTIKLESPDTPVIMLTGWGAFINEDGNGHEDADAILSKPPRSRELREMLQRFSPGQNGKH